jgi:hypothetical protein
VPAGGVTVTAPAVAPTMAMRGFPAAFGFFAFFFFFDFDFFAFAVFSFFFRHFHFRFFAFDQARKPRQGQLGQG